MLSTKRKRKFTKGLDGDLSVYLLTTKMSLEEVRDILPELTDNYLQPVILDYRNKYNPLKLVYLEHPSILFDDNNPIDCQDYAIMDNYPGFEKYVGEHLDEIRRANPSIRSVKDVIYSVNSRKPSNLHKFLPDPPEIPEIMRLSWWTGKIGFIGQNENWEKNFRPLRRTKSVLGESLMLQAWNNIICLLHIERLRYIAATTGM